MPRNIKNRQPVPSEAHDESYAPEDTTDWTNIPANTGDALDELAATGGGGGGGAPTDVQYVTLATDGDLSDERVLTAGDGVALADGGAGGNVTIKTTTQVYITGVTGSGTITNKAFESNTVPANKILTAFESDNDDITVTVEMHAGSDAWQPGSVAVSLPGATTATILKQNWVQVDSTRIWTATANIADAGASDTITATMSDGDTATCTYTRALDPPLILTGIIDDHPTTTGGDAECPLAQTQVSAADQITISGTAEAHCTHVYVKDFEVTNGEGLQGPFTIAQFNAGVAINVGTGNDATANYKIYGTVGTGGTPGADFTSTESIAKDQTLPTFSSVGHSYPASQAALKNVETDSVTITHTNIEAGDDYVYDNNSTGELTIPAATTYAAIKALVRLSGDYRDSGTNYRLTVTRLAKNGLSTIVTATVKIAHVAPTIDITNNGEGSPKVFRSKTGADQTYTITITSDQELEVAPTLARDGSDDGPALGTFTGGSKVWTATLTCQEDDTKNVAAATHDFTTLVARNNADVTQNTIGSGSAYGVAGFEQRDVAVLKFDQLEPIGTMVSNRDNANNLVMSYVGLGDGTYAANTTDDPGSKKFTITNSGGTFDADGDHIKCNDSNIYDAVDYTMRIEESA